MAPAKETIRCDLDRPRELRLTFRELAALQRALPGENPLRLIDALLTRVEDGGDVQIQCGNLWALQALLWASLHWDDPDLTLDGTSDLITLYVHKQQGNLADLAAQVRAAYSIGGLQSMTDDEKNAVAEAMSTPRPSTSALGGTLPDTSPTSSDAGQENGST